MQFFNDVIDIVSKYRGVLLKGVGNTMLIALAGTVLGLLIGILIGIFKTIPNAKKKPLLVLQRAGNIFCNIYIEIFRGTPMMVQAMVIYWGYAFATGGTLLDPIVSGIAIVSINTGAYMAEIVRGGIMSIDKGQFEASSSVGMTHFQAMIHVIIPQVMRNILPSISNEFVINIKDTSVLNVVMVKELFYYATFIQLYSFKTFEIYLVVCVIYFALTFSITRLLRLFEKLLAGSNVYTICGSQSDPDAEIHIKKEEKVWR